jgi:hypothetical protein
VLTLSSVVLSSLEDKKFQNRSVWSGEVVSAENGTLIAQT